MLSWPPKIRSLVVIGFIAGVISVYGFNCAQKGFETETVRNSVVAFNHPISDPIEKITTSDEQIINYEGVVHSMLKLTNQSDLGDSVNGSTLRKDFDAYKSLLPEGGDLNRVTAPTLVAITNIASRVCANLINKEKVLPVASRDFFANVDFFKSFSGMDQETVRSMAESFWGHEVSADEWSAIVDGAKEFSDNFTEGNPASGTSKSYMFYLSMCTSLLSSFDSVSY